MSSVDETVRRAGFQLTPPGADGMALGWGLLGSREVPCALLPCPPREGVGMQLQLRGFLKVNRALVHIAFARCAFVG